MRILSAESVKAERREQTHDAARDARCSFHERMVLRDFIFCGDVGSTADVIELSRFDQLSKLRRRESGRPRIASAKNTAGRKWHPYVHWYLLRYTDV